MKILISSCLLGENVRYDGLNSFVLENDSFSKFKKEIFANLLAHHEIFPFCPEVSGGLSTPRNPVEIVQNNPLKLQTKNGEDFTKNFLIGAKNCLDLCKKENIKLALLKAKSPSCGNIQIYDGTFTNTLKESLGISAKLLLENGIKVFNENQLKQLIKYVVKMEN